MHTLPICVHHTTRIFSLYLSVKLHKTYYYLHPAKCIYEAMRGSFLIFFGDFL